MREYLAESRKDESGHGTEPGRSTSTPGAAMSASASLQQAATAGPQLARQGAMQGVGNRQVNQLVSSGGQGARAQLRPEERAGEALRRAMGAPAVELPYRERLEQELGVDLERVVAHSGDGAAEACEMVGARAFAAANHVVLGTSPPALDSVRHEVAHVLQQGGDRPEGRLSSPPGSLELGERDDGLERQARSTVERLRGGSGPSPAAPGAQDAGQQSKSSGIRLMREDPYEGMTPVQKVRKALEDDEGSDALRFMQELDAGGAGQILASCRDLAVSAFGNDEMGQAARILTARGGPLLEFDLKTKLQWMFAEGTSYELSAVGRRTDRQRQRAGRPGRGLGCLQSRADLSPARAASSGPARPRGGRFHLHEPDHRRPLDQCGRWGRTGLAAVEQPARGRRLDPRRRIPHPPERRAGLGCALRQRRRHQLGHPQRGSAAVPGGLSRGRQYLGRLDRPHAGAPRRQPGFPRPLRWDRSAGAQGQVP